MQTGVELLLHELREDRNFCGLGVEPPLHPDLLHLSFADELFLFLLYYLEIALSEHEKMASRPIPVLYFGTFSGIYSCEEPLLLGDILIELLLLPPDHLGVHLHQPLLGNVGGF